MEFTFTEFGLQSQISKPCFHTNEGILPDSKLVLSFHKAFVILVETLFMIFFPTSCLKMDLVSSSCWARSAGDWAGGVIKSKSINLEAFRILQIYLLL